METLRILVPATFIEDGTFRPAIGLDAGFPLSFVEVDESIDPDPVLHPRRGFTATELGRPRSHTSYPFGGRPQGPPVWPTLLHGPGWTASWDAPRPVDGDLDVRGWLCAELDVTVGPWAWASGRVSRVRIVTQADTTVATTLGGLTHRVVPGSRTYHDVPSSPLVFDRGTDLPPSAHHRPVPTAIDPTCVLPPTARVHQIGVLVDLDLTRDEAVEPVRA